MNKFSWEQFNNNNPAIILSPMDGYTDSAMRTITKEINPNVIVVTEFTSADGLYHAREKVVDRLAYRKMEHPIVAQIYGGNLQTFKDATKLCEELGFDAIDINMGCPAKKVVKSEQGIALRRKLDLAFKLIETVVKSTNLPVSVKTRLGWNDASDLIEFGTGAQNAGAQLISIHGRTYQEPYGVPAQFDPIYELKKAVDIPVFGNGGIIDLDDGIQKLGNLDGFLIGQAAMGNPWCFLPRSEQPKHFSEKIPVIERHIKYLIEDIGEEKALLDIRKHLLAYIKGIHGASKFRAQLATVKTLKEAQKVLDIIKSSVQ